MTKILRYAQDDSTLYGDARDCPSASYAGSRLGT